jgi:hypothetical protein
MGSRYSQGQATAWRIPALVERKKKMYIDEMEML